MKKILRMRGAGTYPRRISELPHFGHRNLNIQRLSGKKQIATGDAHVSIFLPRRVYHLDERSGSISAQG